MALDVEYAVNCILQLDSHKWYVDVRYLAHVLNMSCEELQEVVIALKKGGRGTRTCRSGESFVLNPKPYHNKISFSESVDNILNLHEADFGCKDAAPFLAAMSPSDAVLHEQCRYYQIGNN